MPMNRSDEWTAQVAEIVRRWRSEVEQKYGRPIPNMDEDAWRDAYFAGYSVAEYVIALEDRKAA
jgi:hypothetical protein